MLCVCRSLAAKMEHLAKCVNLSNLRISRSATSSKAIFDIAKQTSTSAHETSSSNSNNITSVLPTVDVDSSTEFAKLDQRIQNLDSLLSELNVKIAEQREQLNQEADEMTKQYGVILPGDYMNLVNSVDVDCPPSKYPCVGCGAPIHCCAPHQPGFISSEKFKALNDVQKQNCICLRCQGLEHHNVLLDAKVKPEEYRRILADIKDQRSVILHVVDVTDYCNSMISDLLDIVGHKHPIYIIVNKIDLLPKDAKGYLNRIEKQIHEHAVQLYGNNVKYVGLVSALTGYGIERLVNKIFNHAFTYNSHIHLIGCTNSGKSSLFNALLGSDLCKLSARNKICKATTSIWPGTTLNLLKFPITKPPRHMLAMRAQRLKDAAFEQDDDVLEKARSVRSTTLRGLVEVTPDPELEEDFHLSQNFSTESAVKDEDLSCQYSFSKGKVVEAKQGKGSLDYKRFENSRWLFDTPGLVNSNQIINDLSMVDLKRLLIKRMPLPRTFIMKQGRTLFVGGLARLDILEVSSKEELVLITVIAAGGLPVTIVNTESADSHYSESLKNNLLMVPSPETADMVPSLKGSQFEIAGAGKDVCGTDVQLSSIGWASVSCSEGTIVSVKAYTPAGVGCHTRPSLLPYAVLLKGKRIKGTYTFALRKPMK